MTNFSYEQIKTVILKLLAYCQANNWAGYDPYDALNSKVFNALPFLNFRLPRLILTQLLKRSPINLRPLLLIPRTENPKAIALFLTALLKLKKLGLLEDESLISLMIQKLITLRSPRDLTTRNSQLVTRNVDNPYFCWGYSFPWQTRTILVPNGYPNLVCTTFVANALLDAYEQNCKIKKTFDSSDLPAKAMASAGGVVLQPQTSNSTCLDMAISAADYILNKLYWEDGNGVASFCYPFPSLRTRVHNANFLGAALLSRVYKHSGIKKFLNPALKVAWYSAANQRNNGSWNYGEHQTQHWIDNFHTGYNLCALRSIGQYTGVSDFESHIHLGFQFYQKHFFREDGAPKYFHNRAYPIDAHSVAQSIITLIAFRDLDESNVSLAHSVFKWAMTHMWDEQGYFYYQVLPYYKNKIPYMRWSQAWMLLALTTLLEQSHTGTPLNKLKLRGNGIEWLT